MAKDFTKTDIQNIVQSEIKSYIQDELDEIVSKLMKKSTSKTRTASKDLVKLGLSKLAEFLWIRKSVWQGDIR